MINFPKMYTVTSYSDASFWGWGGYVVQVGGSISKGNFSEFDAGKSSSSSAELIQSQILKHCTDNKNITRVLSVGNRKP